MTEKRKEKALNIVINAGFSMWDIYEYAVHKYYLGEKDYAYDEMWEIFRGKVMLDQKYNGEPILHYDAFINKLLREVFIMHISDIARKAFRSAMGLLKTEGDKYEEYGCEYHQWVSSQVDNISERFDDTYDHLFGLTQTLTPEEMELINQIQIVEDEPSTSETTDL